MVHGCGGCSQNVCCVQGARGTWLRCATGLKATSHLSVLSLTSLMRLCSQTVQKADLLGAKTDTSKSAVWLWQCVSGQDAASKIQGQLKQLSWLTMSASKVCRSNAQSHVLPYHGLSLPISLQRRLVPALPVPQHHEHLQHNASIELQQVLGMVLQGQSGADMAAV